MLLPSDDVRVSIDTDTLRVVTVTKTRWTEREELPLKNIPWEVAAMISFLQRKHGEGELI